MKDVITPIRTQSKFHRKDKPENSPRERLSALREIVKSSVPAAREPIQVGKLWRVGQVYNPVTVIPTVISMSLEGCSRVEIVAELGISLSTFDRWIVGHPEFADAVEKALLYSQAWWERAGRLNLSNPQFNSSLFLMNMTNRFGWTRRIDGKMESTTTEVKRLEVSITEEQRTELVQRRTKVLQILQASGALQHLLPEKAQKSPDEKDDDVLDILPVLVENQ